MVPYQPILLNMMKVGIISTAKGISMVTSKKLNKNLLPRNCMREKAKAHIVQEMTEPTTLKAKIFKVFRVKVKKGKLRLVRAG